MRIAHVSDCYLPRIGGIEMHVHDLAEQQRALGHDAVVLTTAPASRTAAQASRTATPASRPDDDVPVLVFPGLLGIARPDALAALRHVVASGGYDVVHVHSSLFSPLGWSAARAASAAGVPTVLTMHSVAPSAGPLAAVLRSLDQGAGRRVHWTAVSEAAARPLRQALVDRPVCVLPNGIDPVRWRSPPLDRSGQPLTIVSVMRLSRRKRSIPLVRMLADIRRRVPAVQELRAVVVGSGPQAGALRAVARAEGVDDWLELPGRLEREQIRRLLARSDVYLAPARLESFGIAALEARCAGLPVVAMACGGVGEIVRDGVEGFVVQDDREMARAAAYLLRTPQLLWVMQAHNRTTVPSTTWDAVLELTLAAYTAAGARIGTSRTALEAMT